VPGLFVAGELMHAHDYRVAAGGAIHGCEAAAARARCR
jgi:thioredoxin reductase